MVLKVEDKCEMGYENEYQCPYA